MSILVSSTGLLSFIRLLGSGVISFHSISGTCSVEVSSPGRTLFKNSEGKRIPNELSHVVMNSQIQKINLYTGHISG